MKRKRPLRNTAERQFEEMMMRGGWEVFKRGMPDFACFKDGEFLLVEVKSKSGPSLSKYQHRVLSKLWSDCELGISWTTLDIFIQDYRPGGGIWQG